MFKQLKKAMKLAKAGGQIGQKGAVLLCPECAGKLDTALRIYSQRHRGLRPPADVIERTITPLICDGCIQKLGSMVQVQCAEDHIKEEDIAVAAKKV